MTVVLEPLSGLIEVTANLSNAMLVAMMPYVSDATKSLELPLPLPIDCKHVVGSGVTPFLNSEGGWGGFGIELSGGWRLGFHWGYLDYFESPNSYFALQDPDEIPRFVGPVRMTQAEAVLLARETLKRLGIPLEKVFAEQEPRVTPPEKSRTGIVPRYRIKWGGPRGGESLDLEINADAKRVERFIIGFNPNLCRPWPKIEVKPVMRSRPPCTNPEYAKQLIPIILQAVDDYGKTLKLSLPRPLTTNHVARLDISDNGGWPHCEIELTNGWRFIYRNSMVNGFYAPDNLFENDRRPMLIKDYVGKWNMTQTQAIDLIRRTIAKLDYPTNLVRMDFPPQIHTSTITNIPRCSFWWWCENETKDDLVSKVEAEVDMERGRLTALYFDHKAFWNKPPPILVPISLGPANQQEPIPSPKPERFLMPKPSHTPFELPAEK